MDKAEAVAKGLYVQIGADVDDTYIAELKSMIAEHVEYTGSPKGKRILEDLYESVHNTRIYSKKHSTAAW